MDFLLAAVTDLEVATHAEAPGYFTDGAVWVAFSMIAVITLLLWKKVPTAIGKSLDDKILAIREQLDEAKTLRAEAEALKKEYEGKAAAAEQDAADIRARAEDEASAIVAKAETDAKALVARKKTMAEAKIAAEQRATVAELKAVAANAAAAAAAAIISEQAGADADKQMVDDAIANV